MPQRGTLTYLTYEPLDDAVQRARGRRKLMSAIAPGLVVAAILAVALVIVMFISMKASGDERSRRALGQAGWNFMAAPFMQ